MLADDYGNLRTNPRHLEGAVFWAQPCRNVGKALDELAASGLLTPYTVRGQDYAHVTNWEKHQRVDRPGKPRVPDIREADANHSRTNRESIATDLRPPTPTSDPDHRPSGDGVVSKQKGEAEEAIAHLNAVTGRKFEDASRALARLRDGASLDDLKLVIDGRWRAWKDKDFNGTPAVEYMRPTTLFGKEKFPEYLAAARAAPPGVRPEPLGICFICDRKVEADKSRCAAHPCTACQYGECKKHVRAA